MTRFHALTIPALATAFVATAPASAQYTPPQVQMVPGATPDADALAAAMRRLGADPRDLQALIAAGELSLKLGDPSAAAALFRRAEQIDPMNGRVKAGMARILVSQERPGEALRYFDQAAGYGLDPRTFAADRALAYDLIGEQERAQRDYRVALRVADGDEVRRRYALSLGISGRKQAALEQIDTLLRRNDRGAWRARAFILAMNDDNAGATKIATSMMPPPMAQAMLPFFAMLPRLAPTDRAFAVHFGEVRATPQRLADARMAPALPVLGPDPNARPVAVAALQPARTISARDRRRLEREQRSAARLAQVESRRSSSRTQRAATTVAARPAPTRVAAAPVAVRSVPVTPAGSAAGPVARAPVQLADATPRPGFQRFEPFRARVSPVPTPIAARIPPAIVLTPAVAAPFVTPIVAQPIPAAVASPSFRIVQAIPSPFVSLPSQPSVAAVAAAPVQTPVPAPVFVAPAPVAVAASTPVAPRMSEDSILARIIAGISIPGEELGVTPPPVRETIAPAPAPTPPVTVAAASVAPAPDPARAAAERKALADAKLAEIRRAAAAKKVADAKAAAAKKVADEKALAAKKAAEEKALATKEAAAEKKAARAEPARIWVQVAGGAFVGDLAKAWAAVRTQAPVLAGRQAWSTPLRATNRVVTGPFKTDAEARALVNQLARQGVSAFPFTSTPGQKMTRLPTR